MAIDFTKSYPVIEWDLNGPHFYTKYFGKKDENARGFKVQILQDGEVLIPTTETLRIYCKKKDGTKVYIDSLSKIDTYFIINLTNQVFAIAGIVECELELSSNSKRIYSPTFGINVSDNLVDGSIVSSDDFIALQNALNKVDNLEETYAPRLTAVETGKIDKSAIVNNTVTTTPETVLDGRVGKTLQDQITTINDNLAQYMTTRTMAGITDVNDLITTGIYGISESASTTLLNMPTARKGVLIVFKGSYIVHMYIDSTNVLYTRFYNATAAVWTAWAIK